MRFRSVVPTDRPAKIPETACVAWTQTMDPRREGLEHTKTIFVRGLPWVSFVCAISSYLVPV